MDNVSVPHDKIQDFCRRHSIRKLAFFGSVVRADFQPGSDIDVLVEFGPEGKIGFFELFDMEQELSRLFGGRKVDLNTPNSLSKYFRQQVLYESQVEYVEA